VRDPFFAPVLPRGNRKLVASMSGTVDAESHAFIGNPDGKCFVKYRAGYRYRSAFSRDSLERSEIQKSACGSADTRRHKIRPTGKESLSHHPCS
jgi:hypothetical protein